MKARVEQMVRAGRTFGCRPIAGPVTANGIRASVDDGSWALVCVSSNKPEVVVVESPVSDARMREMFHAIDGLLRKNPEIGAYNQTI